MSNFGVPHAIAALQIVAYLLANDPGRKWIACKAAKPQDNLRLYYDADSSYADCPDTGRSRWGVTGSINDTFIDAGTGMFPNVRPSTFAAETGALAKATLRVLTARRYMADFGFPQDGPVPIGEDNNAALLFSKSPAQAPNSPQNSNQPSPPARRHANNSNQPRSCFRQLEPAPALAPDK